MYMEGSAGGRVCMQEQVQELAWQLGESQRYTEEAKRNGEHFKADNETSLRALKDAQVAHHFCINRSWLHQVHKPIHLPMRSPDLSPSSCLLILQQKGCPSCC